MALTATQREKLWDFLAGATRPVIAAAAITADAQRTGRYAWCRNTSKRTSARRVRSPANSARESNHRNT